MFCPNITWPYIRKALVPNRNMPPKRKAPELALKTDVHAGNQRQGNIDTDTGSNPAPPRRSARVIERSVCRKQKPESSSSNSTMKQIQNTESTSVAFSTVDGAFRKMVAEMPHTPASLVFLYLMGSNNFSINELRDYYEKSERLSI